MFACFVFEVIHAYLLARVLALQPMNLYRSSSDLHPSWHSVLNNLNSTMAYRGGLSGPGCWAYPGWLVPSDLVFTPFYASCIARHRPPTELPTLMFSGTDTCGVWSKDMLQVGVTSHVIRDPDNPYGYSHGGGVRNPHYLNWIEGRTHFAAWCIVSSPLVRPLSPIIRSTTLLQVRSYAYCCRCACSVIVCFVSMLFCQCITIVIAGTRARPHQQNKHGSVLANHHKQREHRCE